ncbi:MAG: hypothetical protein ABI278_08115 [Candidatus Aquilonibacter sp.]
MMLLAAFALIAASSGTSEQKYDVSGNDSFRIGTMMPTTSIAYIGTQRLTIDRNGPARRYTAEATYRRSDDSGKAVVHARFVQELNRAGDFEDRSDGDPDFLTILNQPFAIQLDPTTMHDLRTMHGSIPFQAQSPFGGATLRGFLRPERAGRVSGQDVVGVRFEARGPMSGPMPQHPEASIAGTIIMDGTAYYATHSALLLALNATLSISGSLIDRSDEVPVKIVYKRSIRANDAAENWSAALHRAD